MGGGEGKRLRHAARRARTRRTPRYCGWWHPGAELLEAHTAREGYAIGAGWKRSLRATTLRTASAHLITSSPTRVLINARAVSSLERTGVPCRPLPPHALFQLSADLLVRTNVATLFLYASRANFEFLDFDPLETRTPNTGSRVSPSQTRASTIHQSITAVAVTVDPALEDPARAQIPPPLHILLPLNPFRQPIACGLSIQCVLRHP